MEGYDLQRLTQDMESSALSQQLHPKNDCFRVLEGVENRSLCNMSHQSWRQTSIDPALSYPGGPVLKDGPRNGFRGPDLEFPGKADAGKMYSSGSGIPSARWTGQQRFPSDVPQYVPPDIAAARGVVYGGMSRQFNHASAASPSPPLDQRVATQLRLEESRACQNDGRLRR